MGLENDKPERLVAPGVVVLGVADSAVVDRNAERSYANDLGAATYGIRNV